MHAGGAVDAWSTADETVTATLRLSAVLSAGVFLARGFVLLLVDIDLGRTRWPRWPQINLSKTNYCARNAEARFQPNEVEAITQAASQVVGGYELSCFCVASKFSAFLELRRHWVGVTQSKRCRQYGSTQNKGEGVSRNMMDRRWNMQDWMVEGGKGKVEAVVEGGTFIVRGRRDKHEREK